MSRGRGEAGGFRADRRRTRRELTIAAIGGLLAALPAHAKEQSAKISQIAAAYQGTPKGMFSCAVCTFFIRSRGCKVVTGDQPDRLVRGFRLARLTGWKIGKRRADRSK